MTHFCQHVACMTCPQLPVWVPTASSGGMNRGYDVPDPLRDKYNEHMSLMHQGQIFTHKPAAATS